MSGNASNDDTVDVNGKGLFRITALLIGLVVVDIVSLQSFCWIMGLIDIDARSIRYSMAPLSCGHVACWSGNASTTNLLLDRGCAVNAVNDVGDTALHDTCNYSYVGFIALHNAYMRGSMECVRELLAHGADTSIKNKRGNTALDIAKERQHQTCILALMEHKELLSQDEKEIRVGHSQS